MCPEQETPQQPTPSQAQPQPEVTLQDVVPGLTFLARALHKSGFGLPPADQKQPQQPLATDPFALAIQMQRERMGYKMMEDAMRGGQPEQPHLVKPEETVLGGLIKMMTDFATATINRTTSIQQQQTDPNMVKALTEMTIALQEVRNLGSQKPQTIEEMFKQVETMKKLLEGTQQAAAKEVGWAGKLAEGGADMNKWVEILNLEGRHRSEDRKWQMEFDQQKDDRLTERDIRQRRWEQEDAKWRHEMNIRELEVKDTKEKGKQTSAAFNQLLAGIAQSIRIEPDTSGIAAGASPNSPAAQPVIFNCTKCGKAITVAAGANSVTCDVEAGGCGQYFEAK